ncbi:MAG: HigA family addiction module antidote protein [Acidobacteria bacterium]|jgi:addiction module HigA family antidote|nr:HigA family addiction module antidote protein [Acidobacteriota bacterium]
MPAIGWTQEALAGRLGVSRRTINEILREKRSASADMAHRPARLFDTTPEFWLGLQQDVDLWNARRAAGGEYLKIKPIRKPA